MATVRTAADSERPEIPAWIVEEWKTACTRLKGATPARWLWDLALTPTEQYKLGDDLETAYRRHGGAVGMWRHLYQVSLPQAVVTVATRLDLLRKDVGRAILRAFDQAPDDEFEAVSWAVGRGGLVIVESPREAYWRGEKIEIEWRARLACWELLRALARRTLSGGVVNPETCEIGRANTLSGLKTQKCRLVNLEGFPIELEDGIVSDGDKGYKFSESVAPIHVFEVAAHESLREWRPHRALS